MATSTGSTGTQSQAKRAAGLARPMLDVMAAGAALTGLVALAAGGTVAPSASAQSVSAQSVSAQFVHSSEAAPAAATPIRMSLVAMVSEAAQSIRTNPAEGQPIGPPPADVNQPGAGQPPAGAPQPINASQPVNLHPSIPAHQSLPVRQSFRPNRSSLVHRSSAGQSGYGQRVIMIIRHGEKPGKGGGHGLTSAGWARAQGLTSVFGGGRGFAAPRAIFAAGATGGGTGQRTRETVSPLAGRLHIPVNSRYGKGQEAAMIRAASAQAMHGPVLISWQHGEIPAIAKALKVVGKRPSGWSKGDFDGVWKFTWTPRGWVFSQGSEGLSGGKHGGKHKH